MMQVTGAERVKILAICYFAKHFYHTYLVFILISVFSELIYGPE